MTVGICDDHEPSGRYLEEFISEKFAEHQVVFVATDIDQLFSFMEIAMPEILILDVVMPKMSGIEVTEILMERNCSIAVILISGFTDILFHRDLRCLMYGEKSIIKYIICKGAPEEDFTRAFEAVTEDKTVIRKPKDYLPE